MILKSIRVERFGCLNPGAVVDRLHPNLTVIHGPNGAGKSTLFRALTYALYQRHGLAAQDATAQIVPRGKDVSPRVEVTFEAGGTTWRLSKQFLKKADVELAREENGVFVPHVQGPEAEETLRGLLGSGRNPKGIAGAAYRGIGEILLVDQGSLRMRDLSELARDRLRLVIDHVGTTEGAHDLVAAIERRYAEVFGKTGAARERSAVARIEEELLRLRARREELEAEQARAEQIERDLAALDRDSPARAAEEIERLDAEIKAAWELQVEVGKRRIARDALEKELLASTREVERLSASFDDLQAARAEHQRVAAEHAAAEVRLRELEEDAVRALRLRHEAEAGVARTLAADRLLADRERSLGDAKRALDLASRIPDLDDRVSRHAATSLALAPVERAIAARRRPSPEEMGAIREQFQLLKARERDAALLDVRIRVTAEADVPVELGPERVQLAARESRDVVTGDAIEVRIPGVARIEVQAPGVLERARLSEEIEAARGAVHETGLSFGTGDPAKLEELAQERVRLEGDLARLLATRDGLFKTERKAKDAEAELSAARVTLAELLGRHPEWGGSPPDPASLVRVEHEIVLERRHLAAARAVGQELLDSRQAEAERSAKAAADAEDRLAALKLDVTRCDERIAQLGGADRNDDTRAARLREAAAIRDGQEAALAACRAQLDSLGDPQGRVNRLTDEKRSVETAKRKAEEDRVRLTDRLDQIRARGIWRDLGDVAARIESVEGSLDRERLAADALKLVRDVLVREQAAAVETAIRPVAERVVRMSRFLFGASARPTLGERFVPQALATDGPDLPVELLSAGTQDQLALLARMALGEIYAEKCGRHAFVLDDPLVNSDRDRRGRLLELFAASRTLQIVIFTCSPELYRGLPEDRCSFVSMEDAKLQVVSESSNVRSQPA